MGRKERKKREGGGFILLHLLRRTSYFPHLFQSSFLSARESSFNIHFFKVKPASFLFQSLLGPSHQPLFALAAWQQMAVIRTPQQCHRTHHNVPALCWSTTSSQHPGIMDACSGYPPDTPSFIKKGNSTSSSWKAVSLSVSVFFPFKSQRERLHRNGKMIFWINIQPHFKTWNSAFHANKV